jgi:hypothetical protein
MAESHLEILRDRMVATRLHLHLSDAPRCPWAASHCSSATTRSAAGAAGKRFRRSRPALSVNSNQRVHVSAGVRLQSRPGTDTGNSTQVDVRGFCRPELEPGERVFRAEVAIALLAKGVERHARPRVPRRRFRRLDRLPERARQAVGFKARAPPATSAGRSERQKKRTLDAKPHESPLPAV